MRNAKFSQELQIQVEKRSELFICAHNETLPVPTMSVGNEDPLPGGIPLRHSPTRTGRTELVDDDFLHTFTRFVHQKIVAVSIRHAKLAMTSMEKNKITGGCYCGEVRFSASPEVRVRTNCHCQNCRRAAGAQAVAWIIVKRSPFQFVKGTPRRYQTETGAWRTFCDRCGTSLTYETDKRPDEIDITTGSLDHPEDFPPTKDVYPEERLPWVDLIHH
jgi:hypothetical protein